MSFLITGAQMGNKGAQSMLYVMVSELRERFPDKKIYFATAESYDEKNYNFKKLACNSMTKRIAALEGNKRRVYYVKAFCRDLVAFFAGKKRCLWHYNDLLDIEDDLDAIIDVSGFAIGDKWSTWSHESFFDIIRFAKRKDIPVYIMPQSFGPFNYSEKQMYLKSLVKEMLEYPRIVFAREKSSYKNLVDIGLKKVSLVPDLVLQSKEINLKLVFKKNPVIKIPDISTENNVGIIPNSQCFKYGDEDKLLSLYRKIIDSLIEKKCNVYIFRHSSEDYDVCKTIYKPYENVKQVKMIDHNFSSLEYSQFIINFNYIICIFNFLFSSS